MMRRFGRTIVKKHVHNVFHMHVLERKADPLLQRLLN